MREATGNALLTMMITSIIAVIMMFFVGSISYSKSYKLKNYIINEIEENGGWDPTLQVSVDAYMKDAGYNVRKDVNKCNTLRNIDFDKCKSVNINSTYDYCVYGCDEITKNVYSYYKVVTFMKFEFPVIGDIVKFEVKGETNTFNDFNH